MIQAVCIDHSLINYRYNELFNLMSQITGFNSNLNGYPLLLVWRGGVA